MLFRVRIQWELFFLVSEKLHSDFETTNKIPVNDEYIDCEAF